MAKKTYDNSVVNLFPDNFKLELPNDYRIDIDYDEDGEQMANLRGGFSINDEGEETSEFSAAFIKMNSTIDNRENLIREGKLKNHFVPGMMMDQVAEGVMTQLQEQFGHGTRLNLYNSYPASVIMKFYKPLSIFGITLESYIVMYLVEVTENTFFGINTVYQNNEEGNDTFFKHLLNVIKSVRVSGKPIDIGKLTPKKLEKALDMEPGEDVEALDLGVSIGINFQYGDEETHYTLNSDGSISEEKVNTGFEYTSPDEALYPHYNSMLRTQGLGMFGLNIVVNQTGTEYHFYNLAEDLDEDASDELKTAIRQLNDLGAANYTLAGRAEEMMSLFHVAPEVFDTAHDRECELQEGLMHRAYMMSALRSFAWTMSKYCNALDKKPADLTLGQIQSIIDTIADSNWLNYDDKSVCKGLCGTQDLHVYYLPDKTPESVKAVFRPSQEVLDQTKQMQEKFPNYNPILSQIGSLDKLRKDLEYIHPAVETLYKDLKANRNYNEALLGNDADILYAWCALSYAARGPFFSEDGPTSCWFSQSLSEEERRIASEKERKELCDKWLKTNGKYLEKNPHIDFSGKKFVFTGLGYRQYSMEDETPYTQLVEDRGGLTRSKVSGVTDYLVIEPAGAGESKLSEALEQQRNGKPIKIILIDDLRKALGLTDYELQAATDASEKPIPAILPTEEIVQATEETVIVDNTWAILVPTGFKYSTDKNVIGNHRNIIIMEDKADNMFEWPFDASISFTSAFNDSQDTPAPVMAKLMTKFMGSGNEVVLKDEGDIYVVYWYDKDRSEKNLQIFQIQVGCGKGVSGIQVFFSDSKMSRREQTKLVEKVAKSIRLSKPGEKNSKHNVKLHNSVSASSNVSKSSPTSQNLSSLSAWNFSSADVEEKKKKLINNEKGYAVRFIPHSLALNSWRTEKANFQYYCAKHYPEYGAKVMTLLEKAEEYSSVFAADGTDKDLKKGMLKNTAPIHALRSFIWTANETQSSKKVKSFPYDAPVDMWISLAAFIGSKGYANYKPYKKDSGCFGEELILNKEIRYYYKDVFDYITSGFYTDMALGKTMGNADHYSLFKLVDTLTAVIPVMDLYYDQLKDADTLNSANDYKMIIKGWVAFAYACKQPFYVAAGDKYVIEGEVENDLSWVEKPEVNEYGEGAFTTYGTEIVSVNKVLSGDVLKIPEGITGIVVNDETKDGLRRGFEKYRKIVYPYSYKGKLILTSQTEEIEVLGDLPSLKLLNISPNQEKARLKKLELKGTVTNLVASSLANFPALRVLTLPEGLIAMHDYSLSSIGIEELYLPESLKKIEDEVFTLAPNSHEITIYVYKTCPALSRIQKLLDKRAKSQIEFNERFSYDTDPYNIKLKLLDSPWITRADTFTYKVKHLYSDRKEANITENEIKTLISDILGNAEHFKKAIGPLEEKAKSRGLNLLAEAISKDADVAEIYEKLPGLLAKDINEQIEGRIQKEKERKLNEIKTLSQSNSMSDLKKAITMLEEFKEESANAEALIKQCSSRLESIKEEKYIQAVSLAEECTVDSIKSALLKMRAISPYKDSSSKIIEWNKRLNNEEQYVKAVSSMKGDDISSLILTKGLFDKLGDYKDSIIKAAACEKYINELCENTYQEARLAESEYSIDSQAKAIEGYKRVGNYKDASDRIAVCNSNIAIIAEYLELKEKLENHKKELGTLNGFFKRRQRQEKEEQIKQIEQQLEELSSKLGDA